MKRSILTFIILCCTLLINAQTVANFSITEDGTFIMNEGKSYFVVQYEGQDSTTLIDNYLTYIKSIYTSVNDRVEVNKNTITINSTDLDEIKYGDAWSGIRTFYMNYVLRFQFKQGRVRIDVPSIKLGGKVYGNINSEDWSTINKKLHLFKDGLAKSAKAQNFINKINSDINRYINRIIKNSSTKTEDNW